MLAIDFVEPSGLSSDWTKSGGHSDMWIDTVAIDFQKYENRKPTPRQIRVSLSAVVYILGPLPFRLNPSFSAPEP